MANLLMHLRMLLQHKLRTPPSPGFLPLKRLCHEVGWLDFNGRAQSKRALLSKACAASCENLVIWKRHLAKACDHPCSQGCNISDWILIWSWPRPPRKVYRHVKTGVCDLFRTYKQEHPFCRVSGVGICNDLKVGND
jgi:hypothetical protein